MKKSIDYQKIFLESAPEFFDIDNGGEFATYIPELGKVAPSKLGIHLTTVGKSHFASSDSNEQFSIQSIAKIYSLTRP